MDSVHTTMFVVDYLAIELNHPASDSFSIHAVQMKLSNCDAPRGRPDWFEWEERLRESMKTRPPHAIERAPLSRSKVNRAAPRTVTAFRTTFFAAMMENGGAALQQRNRRQACLMTKIVGKMETGLERG